MKNLKVNVYLLMMVIMSFLGCTKDGSTVPQGLTEQNSTNVNAIVENDQLFASYQQRCTTAGCQYFQQLVPPNHQHYFTCRNVGCRYFQQFVPPNHQHHFRCASLSCLYFQQFVPPNHKHVRRN